MVIPQGNNKEDLDRRKDIISQVYRKWTEKHPDKRVFNQSLQGYINIRFLSITETIRHASKTPASTGALLHLDNILSEAMIYGKPKAAKKGVKNQKAFIKMLELRCELEGVGTVKMMVGVKPTGEMIQYCITAVRT